METGWRWAVSIRPHGFSVLFALALSLTGCVQSAGSDNWRSPLYQIHPLVGQIWSSREETFVDEEDLWAAVSSAQYILLGEKHDNPDHHDLQLMMLNQLVESGNVSHVTFEMLDSTADSALAGFADQQFSDADDINAYLQWDNEGWNWEFYGPLLETAYNESVAVRSGNISNETVSSVYGSSTPPEIAAVLDREAMERLHQEIDESHCGLLPQSQFPAMVRVQQARDYRMASQLQVNESSRSAVLIAGNYHVRQDLGVPNYLLAQNSGLSREDIVSVGLLEVQDGEKRPQRYLDQFSEVPAYDFIWFTPAVTAEDYCDSLRQR